MREKIVIFLCLVLLDYSASSQMMLMQDKNSLPLTESAQVKAIRVPASLLFAEIVDMDNWHDYDSTFVPSKDQAVWLRFSVLNNKTKPTYLYFYSSQPFVTVYKATSEGFDILKNGFLRPLKERSNKNHTHFIDVKLQPSKETLLFIKLQGSDYTKSYSFPSIHTKLSYYETLHKIKEYSRFGVTFNLIYLSSLFVITFFVFILLIRVKQRIYIYYLLYLFFQIIYGLIIYGRGPTSFGNIFLYFPILGYQMMEAIQFVFIGFYILFILQLLEVTKYDIRLSKAMKYLAIFCFSYAIFRLFHDIFVAEPNANVLIFTIVRFIILPINLILIIWVIIKVKHPLINYFIIGNVFFFAGSVISVYAAYNSLNLQKESIFYFGNSLNTVFQMGLLGEVLCFAFAIAHHVRLIQQSKENTTAAYITQLKENQLLQENMNKELDKKVNEKTDELISVYSAMEKQREKELKSTFTQKIKETEMLALRSQMNPHFLFNSLNAIKHLMMTARDEDAMNYLDDFSGLLRAILQNSKQEVITVEDEFESLELYLALEKGRLGNELNYTIKIANHEELSQYIIPPLLLQPFVENAIWHGLKPSPKPEKLLEICFLNTENLIISIRDNGIGRKAATKTNGKNINKSHRSLGMEITQERLALFNHLHDTKIILKVTDLEEDNVPAGTLITFTYSN